MKRSQPLRPGTKPLRREVRIRPVNPKRRAKLSEAQYGHETGKRAWIQSLPCAVTGAPPPSEAAHVKSKGARGKAEHLVPLSFEVHRRQHAEGWLRATGRNREWWLARAASLEARWQELERAA